MKIEKIYLTKDNLTKIKNIDDLCYNEENKTDLNWYLERFTPNHIAYVILDENNNYIGYIIAVPIKKELYDAITNGVLINDLNINPAMFIASSKYNYIVSFVILEGYRHQGLGINLIKNIINIVEKGKYCALTISEDGEMIAKKFMHLKHQINDKTAVFEINI